MKKEAGQQKMAELARVAHELAELDARRAELQARQAGIFSALAEGQTVDLRTSRKTSARHVPKLGAVNELDQARATAALREIGMRRRLSR